MISEFKKLDFVSYILEGKSFAEALSGNGLELAEGSAFFTKRELKEELFFTDKRIKEFLGQPDRVTKLKGSGDKVAHLYSKTRVQGVLESPEYQIHAEKVKVGREKRKELVQDFPIIRSSEGQMAAQTSSQAASQALGQAPERQAEAPRQQAEKRLGFKRVQGLFPGSPGRKENTSSSWGRPIVAKVIKASMSWPWDSRGSTSLLCGC